jgi:hypothetical protein
MSEPVVRVSILRVEPDRFEMFRQLMADAETTLAPGIRAMRGCRLYFAGADEASASLTNVSVWDTLADAQQMDDFAPMLALGRHFADLGAVFERPIMNYATLWSLGIAPQAPAA